MFRTLSLVLALVLATAFSVSDGAAQAKRESAVRRQFPRRLHEALS